MINIITAAAKIAFQREVCCLNSKLHSTNVSINALRITDGLSPVIKAYPHNISYSENNIIQGSKKVHVHTRSDADPLRFKLKLHNILPAFSKNASYRELHWEVQNQNGLLEPTTYRNVIIGSNTPVTTLVLPVSAIRNINSDGEESVFVVDENNVIHSRSVSLGIRNEDYAEIVSGLDEGELVASIGVNSLSDKMTIQPIVKDEENER